MTVDQEASASEYISVQEVADYTGLSAKFWNNLRSNGGGPVYVKLSARAVRYRRADVDGWMAERIRRSTFDDRPVVSADGRP
jgi:predicted DNA-binding transcriptional regulator AlpA